MDGYRDNSNWQRPILQRIWEQTLNDGHPVFFVHQKYQGHRAHGDEEIPFAVWPPYEPLSEPAQRTGNFVTGCNALVDLEMESDGMMESDRALCGACYNSLVYFRRLRPPEIVTSDGDLRVGDNTDPRESMPVTVVHHEDLDSFLASVGAGCYLCEELRTPLEMMLPNARLNIRLEICWYFSAPETPYSGLYFSFTSTIEERGPSNYSNYYTMHAYPEEKYAKFFKSPILDHERSVSTGSPFNRELARYWFRDCCLQVEGKHLQCHLTYPDWAPRRLIDAEGARASGMVRLVEHEDLPKEPTYITLSYVWGPEGPQHLPLLTSKNLEERKGGIPLHTLPKTFQDAIEVTEWFHAKWLWIDCMCILQDVTTDWITEVNAMSITYCSAILNISADASSDARGGLFVERDPANVGTWHLRYGSYGWYIHRHHYFERKEANETPSYERAWIFRERQLARRILHFTPKQLVWECCGTGLVSEMFPGGAPFAPFDATFGSEAKDQWLSRGGTINEQEMSADALHESWNMLCDAFTARKLTDRMEMALIISSLAEDFSDRLREDRYVAGLWYTQLPQALLWTSLVLRPEYLGAAAENRVSATWSWLLKCNTVHLWEPRSQMPVLQVTATYSQRQLPEHDSRRVAMLECKGYVRKIKVELSIPKGLSEDDDWGLFRKRIRLIDDEKRDLGFTLKENESETCIIYYDSHIEGFICAYHCLFVNMAFYRGALTLYGLLLAQPPKPERQKGPRRFARAGVILFTGVTALKMRYQLRRKQLPAENRQYDDEERWEKLDEDFRASLSEDFAIEDPKVTPRDVDPGWLYRYDTTGDFSWLKRLESETIELY